jgi:ribonuclease PH
MTTSLSKCYIPLPFSRFSLLGDRSDTTTVTQQQRQQPAHRNRPPNQLRPIYLDVGILSNADGSSIVEIGHTKVVCAVHGPRSFSASSAYDSEIFHEEGVVNVDVKFALPFAIRPETVAMNQDTSVDGTTSNTSQQQASPEEVELSSRVYDAIFSSLVQSSLKRLYKSVIDVHLIVLQSDGGLTSACIVAVSLALADAGIEIYDLVPSCCVAVYDVRKRKEESTTNHPTCLVDPTEDEINDADGIVTLAVSYNCSEVTFWNQTGRISVEAYSQAMEMCKDGCSTIYQCMKQCLLSKSG